MSGSPAKLQAAVYILPSRKVPESGARSGVYLHVFFLVTSPVSDDMKEKRIIIMVSPQSTCRRTRNRNHKVSRTYLPGDKQIIHTQNETLECLSLTASPRNVKRHAERLRTPANLEIIKTTAKSKPLTDNVWVWVGIGGCVSMRT